jgi:hypothetical protein
MVGGKLSRLGVQPGRASTERRAPPVTAVGCGVVARLEDLEGY